MQRNRGLLGGQREGGSTRRVSPGLPVALVLPPHYPACTGPMILCSGWSPATLYGRTPHHVFIHTRDSLASDPRVKAFYSPNKEGAQCLETQTRNSEREKGINPTSTQHQPSINLASTNHSNRNFVVSVNPDCVVCGSTGSHGKETAIVVLLGLGNSSRELNVVGFYVGGTVCPNSQLVENTSNCGPDCQTV